MERSSAQPFTAHRKGAPFQHRFAALLMRLRESGLLDYWMDEVMTSRIKQNREKILGKKEQQQLQVLRCAV